jgi:hypothetical protein
MKLAETGRYADTTSVRHNTISIIRHQRTLDDPSNSYFSILTFVALLNTYSIVPELSQQLSRSWGQIVVSVTFPGPNGTANFSQADLKNNNFKHSTNGVVDANEFDSIDTYMYIPSWRSFLCMRHGHPYMVDMKGGQKECHRWRQQVGCFSVRFDARCSLEIAVRRKDRWWTDA